MPNHNVVLVGHRDTASQLFLLQQAKTQTQQQRIRSGAAEEFEDSPRSLGL